MRILIICSLFLLACNSGSKKSGAEKDTDNTSTVSNDKSADQQKAEANIREYAQSHAKGKPVDFVFDKLEKLTEQNADEVFSVKCSFKETFDDGGNPLAVHDTYFLDKDLNVVRVEFN